jgi:carboxylesterase type B
MEFDDRTVRGMSVRPHLRPATVGFSSQLRREGRPVTLADKGIPTYYYRFSYVAESLNREAASHASDIPFFMNTQALKYGDKITERDNAAGKVIRFS